MTKLGNLNNASRTKLSCHSRPSQSKSISKMHFSIPVFVTTVLACLSITSASPVESRSLTTRSPPGNTNVTLPNTPFKFQYLFTVTAEFRDINGPIVCE